MQRLSQGQISRHLLERYSKKSEHLLGQKYECTFLCVGWSCFTDSKSSRGNCTRCTCTTSPFTTAFVRQWKLHRLRKCQIFGSSLFYYGIVKKNLTQSWTSWWCWAPVTFSTCFVFTGTVSQGEHKEAELATACYAPSAFPPCQMFTTLRTTFNLCFVVFFAFVCRSLLRRHRAKCLNRGLWEQAA